MTVPRRSLLRSFGVATTLGVAAGIGGVGSGVAGRSGSDDPTALVAGSLLRLADRVPGATVEAHGSVAVRRLVVNGMRDPDAVALADPRLFAGVSDRATLFATNALVVAFDPESRFAGALQRDWAGAIERDGIRLGRTNPDTDPLGYRTVMALELAAERHDVDADSVLEDASIFRETDVLNLVDGGKLDAAFVYRNMAVQRDLPFVALPDAIDFSNPAYADVYRSVACEVGGEAVRGAPIRYAATATTAAGESWVERLVSAGDLLRETGFVVPADYPRRERRVVDRASP